MKIDINLSGQETGKFRTFYLVLGILGILCCIVSLVLPELQFPYYAWIVFIPGFIEAILYGLGKKRMFADHFPYLKINEDRIETSKGGLFSTTQVTAWADVTHIDLKLFEIRLSLQHDSVVTVDLTRLTDDNLKIVKEFILTIKQNRNL